MILIPLSLTSVLLALPATPVASDPPLTTAVESELRAYDLAAFRVRVDHAESRPFVPYSRANWEDTNYEYTHSLDADHVTELIGELFGDELEYEDRGLWIDERGRLVVRGPAALQAQVQRTIAFLESTLSAELELRVDRILLDASRASDVTQDGVVPARVAQQLRALSGAGVQRESHVLRVHPGQAARVQRLREYSVVLDYDVEIAQGAAIGDPIAGTIPVGVDLAVRAAPAKGGVALAILGQFADALDRPRTRKDASASFVAGESYFQVLDSPKGTQSVDLSAFSLGSNSFLPDGAALVFRVDSRLDDSSSEEVRTELLVVERGAGGLPRLAQLMTEGATPRRLELLNAELFASPRCVETGARLQESRSYFGRHMRVTEVEEGWIGARLQMGEFDSVAEMLSDVGRSALYFHSDGPWILGLDDADLAEEMRAAGVEPVPLEKDVALLTETPVPLRLEVTLLRDGEEQPVLRLVLPVRSGEETVVSVGREWLETYDFDVEVAQHASVPDPSVRVGFDGMFLRARTSIGNSGGLVLDVSGEARLLARSERFELGSDLMDGVDQSDFDVLVLSERVLLAADREADQPVLIGDPAHLALQVSVTR